MANTNTIIIIIIILIQLEHVFLQLSGGEMTYVGQPGSERRPGFPRQKANGFCHWILDYCRNICIFEAPPEKLKINKYITVPQRTKLKPMHSEWECFSDFSMLHRTKCKPMQIKTSCS